MSFVNLSCNSITNWSKKQTDEIEKFCVEDSRIFCFADCRDLIDTYFAVCEFCGISKEHSVVKYIKYIESRLFGGFDEGVTVLASKNSLFDCILVHLLQMRGCTVLGAIYSDSVFDTFIKYPAFSDKCAGCSQVNHYAAYSKAGFVEFLSYPMLVNKCNNCKGWE